MLCQADVGSVRMSGVKFSWLQWVSEHHHGINNRGAALIEVLRSLWLWPKGSMPVGSWTFFSGDGPGTASFGVPMRLVRKQSCEEATNGRRIP